MKELLQSIVPPIVWRSGSRLGRIVRGDAAVGGEFEYGVEQPREFYDRTYAQRKHWKAHYTQSHYYPLWTVIADRVRQVGARRILDIGCGPGQVACLMR